MSKRVFLSVAACLAIAAQSDAAALLLNFSAGAGTGVTPTAASFRNGPAYANEPSVKAYADAAVNGGTWANMRRDSTTARPFQDASTTPAISVDMGVETGASTSTIQWDRIGTGTTPVDVAGGNINSMASGIYTAGTPHNQWVYTAAGNDFALAARITGLSAGEYHVYVVSRFLNTVKDAGSNVYVGTRANSTENYDFSSLTPTFIANTSTVSTPSSPATWTSGVDYAMFSITVAAGADVIVMAQNHNPLVANGGTGTSGANELRGTFNTIEIVPVPEPTSMALLCLIGLGALTRRRHG